ncbi:MAG: YitT family protein, partial [Bacillota bacterium]|nr:YitT family protein [Bacillota bacterium]
MIWLQVKKCTVVLMGALLNAIGMNLFLIPANVYASGFAGIAQLLSKVIAQYASMHLSTGMLLLILNIPVTILGWVKVGKSFTLFSFISVFFRSIFLQIIPVKEVSHDILLNAVFGGVIVSVGVGFTLR